MPGSMLCIAPEDNNPCIASRRSPSSEPRLTQRTACRAPRRRTPPRTARGSGPVRAGHRAPRRRSPQMRAGAQMVGKLLDRRGGPGAHRRPLGRHPRQPPGQHRRTARAAAQRRHRVDGRPSRQRRAARRRPRSRARRRRPPHPGRCPGSTASPAATTSAPRPPPPSPRSPGSGRARATPRRSASSHAAHHRGAPGARRRPRARGPRRRRRAGPGAAVPRPARRGAAPRRLRRRRLGQDLAAAHLALRPVRPPRSRPGLGGARRRPHAAARGGAALAPPRRRPDRGGGARRGAAAARAGREPAAVGRARPPGAPRAQLVDRPRRDRGCGRLRPDLDGVGESAAPARRGARPGPRPRHPPGRRPPHRRRRPGALRAPAAAAARARRARDHPLRRAPGGPAGRGRTPPPRGRRGGACTSAGGGGPRWCRSRCCPRTPPAPRGDQSRPAARVARRIRACWGCVL